MDNLSMKVEYDDGTWAMIPSAVGADKVDYLRAIQNYQPKPVVEVAVKDHPMKIGDEGTVGEGIPAEYTQTQEQLYDYGAARIAAYPTTERQLEALFDARKGDNTKQTAIDGHIEIVKAKFPVNSTTYTNVELDAALTELKKDSKWTDD